MRFLKLRSVFASLLFLMLFAFSSFAQYTSISGTIKDEDGKPLSDVTVTLNTRPERTTITDINGYYIFSNLTVPNTIIITPSKVNYRFKFVFIFLLTSTEVNFTGIEVPDYYSVSGTIRNEASVPVSGVEVTVGCLDAGWPVLVKRTISDNNGYYIISDLPAGYPRYGLTPTSTDYYFDPQTIEFENLNSDMTLDLTCRDKQFYSISGTIKEANDTPISGVEVTFYSNGIIYYSTVTDINGFYIFSDLPEGEDLDIILYPRHSDYLFDPIDERTQSLKSNLTWDFIGTKRYYIQLSGTIKEANGTPISAVEVSLNKGILFEDTITTTDINGFYSFQNLLVGYYSITPSKHGFAFDPPSIYINETEETKLDFIGYEGSFYIISGIIKDTDNKPISDVRVVLYGDWGAIYDTTTTNSNGFYIFPDLFSEFNYYQITPSHTKYYFDPASRMFDYGLFSDITDANFIATTVMSVDKPDELPSGYSLEQNYPNPFNPSTKIKYTVKESGLVTINLFDVFGREIRKLVNTVQPSGNYEITFDAKDLTSGVYYYKININEFIATKKMLLMK
jgi:hypothetical protein